VSAIDLREVRVVLRERRLLDVLDLAIRFLVAHAVPYIVLSAIVLVPCGVLSLVVAVHSGWVLGWLTAIAVATFAEIPFTILGSRLVFTPEAPLEAVLSASVRKAPRLLAAKLLQGVAVLAGTSAFVAPGVWIAATTLFLSEVILLEESTAGAAFSRAQRLVAGRFGDALMTFLLIGGLHALAVWVGDRALGSILADLFQITPPAKLGEPGGGVLGLVAFFLVVPFAATARLFAYLDLRTRTEGWDVQVRFAALAARREEP
jgi:hypothetical protein